jgi:hypothetical protein
VYTELYERDIVKIREAAIRILEFMHRNEVKTLVAIGPSAVSPARLIIDLWKKRYPGEPIPELHSLGDVIEEHLRRIQTENALKLIGARSRLVEGLKGNTLLFDETIGSGTAMREAAVAFQRLKPKALYTAILYGEDAAYHRPDVVGATPISDAEKNRIEAFLRFRSVRVNEARKARCEKRKAPATAVLAERRAIWTMLRRL